MCSGLSYVVIGVLPAKDGGNLAISYFVQIVASILVMGLVFRGFLMEKKNGVAVV
jgi:hypothetical protein